MGVPIPRSNGEGTTFDTTFAKLLWLFAGSPAENKDSTSLLRAHPRLQYVNKQWHELTKPLTRKSARINATNSLGDLREERAVASSVHM